MSDDRRIKAHPDGTVKAQGRVNITRPWEYDGGYISASCECCSVWPTFPGYSDGYVDLQRQGVYDISVRVQAPGLNYDPGGGGIPYRPMLTIHGTGVFVRLAWEHPLHNQAHVFRLVVSVEIPGLSDTAEYVFDGPFPTPVDARVDISLPSTLFAKFRNLSRFHFNGSPWGPDTSLLDLRDYLDAEFGWLHDPRGNRASTVRVRYENIDRTWSSSSGNITGWLGPWRVHAESMDFSHAVPMTLTASGWDAPEIEETEHEYWYAQDQDGARFVAQGRTFSLYRLGPGSTARGGSIDVTKIQPDQYVVVKAEAVRGNGTPFPAGSFNVQPYDGPNLTPYNINLEADTVWPREDQSEGIQGIPIELSSPGQWSGTGRAFGYAARARFSSPAATATVVERDYDTVGEPLRLAFTYVPSSLSAKGQESAAWRFPLTPDVSVASWPSLRLYEVSSHGVEEFRELDRWTPGPGTVLTLEGGMKMSGTANPLSATGNVGHAGFSGARYLQITYVAYENRRAALVIGEKRWVFDLPASQGWAQVAVIDLCRPDNRAGGAVHTARIEARAAEEPDWAWGVEDPVTLTLEADGEVRIMRLDIIKRGHRGYLLVNEALHDDDRWSYTETITQDGEDVEVTNVVRDIITHAVDGRVVTEAAAGYVRRRDDGPAVPVKKYTLQSVADMIKGTQGKFLARAENERPWTGGLVSYRGFDYYPAEAYFNNRHLAAFLRPRFEELPVEGNPSYTLIADWCVDRAVLHTGVSLSFTSRRMFGPIVAGIYGAQNMNVELKRGETTVSSATTGEGGGYVIPPGGTAPNEELHKGGHTLTPGGVDIDLLHGVPQRGSFKY